MRRGDLVWIVAALSLGVAVAAAGAAPDAGGTIVVRLVTEPAPPGVDWSYSGVGQAFRLGTSGTSRTVSDLADGTYRLAEAGTAPGQPQTLTALTCSDPSGGTTVDRAAGTASIALSPGEAVPRARRHRAPAPPQH